MQVKIENPECLSYYCVDDSGIIFKENSDTPVEYYHSTNGFDYVPLLTKKYGLKLFPVDEVILEAFLSRPVGYNHIIHKDGDRRNNSLYNLEWSHLNESWVYIKSDNSNIKECYRISNFGGFINTKHTIEPLCVNDRGYYCVSIRTKNDTSKSLLLHRLVAKYFVYNPNPSEYDEVNHIDGNKCNNHWKNLEWVSHKMNMKHAFEMGMIYRGKGDELTISKMSNSIVHEICQLFITYYGRAQSVYNHIHEDHPDITLKMIQHIKHKECWEHISDQYWTLNDLNELNNKKIRIICESLIQHNGCVKNVYSDLIQMIPDLTIRFIEIIKNKEMYSEISDEYFHNGDFRTILTSEEISDVIDMLYKTGLDINETYRILRPRMNFLTINKVRKIRYNYTKKLKDMMNGG